MVSTTTRHALHFLVLAKLLFQSCCFVCRTSGPGRPSSPSSTRQVFLALSTTSTPKSSASNLSDELERYRHRTELAESVLKGKVEDLELEHAKLEVLQDVVQKLKIKSRADVEQWEQKYNNLRQELDSARDELANALNEIRKQDESFIVQKERFAERLANEKRITQEYKLKYEDEKAAADQLEQELEKQKLKTESRNEHLKRELARTRQLLEREQALVAEIRRTEQERVAQMEDELLRATENFNNTLLEVEDKLRQEDESIEIAKASVAAAERREADVRAEYEVLLTKFETISRENEELKEKLALSASSKEASTSPEMLCLHEQIEELNEQIRSLKMAHGAEIRAEKRAAQEQIAQVSEKYQRQMQRMRSGVINGSRDQTELQQEASMWRRIRHPFRRNR